MSDRAFCVFAFVLPLTEPFRRATPANPAQASVSPSSRRPEARSIGGGGSACVDWPGCVLFDDGEIKAIGEEPGMTLKEVTVEPLSIVNRKEFQEALNSETCKALEVYNSQLAFLTYTLTRQRDLAMWK